MKGLDSNVIVRYVVQDDPRQSALASEFIENKCTTENPGFINTIVLCELVWVLKRAYKYPKDLIVEVLNTLLDSKELKVEKATDARQAVLLYAQGQADFSDYLIAVYNKREGCDYTVTLDKKAAKSKDFKLLK